jgi:hypothetical protein
MHQNLEVPWPDVGATHAAANGLLKKALRRQARGGIGRTPALTIYPNHGREELS